MFRWVYYSYTKGNIRGLWIGLLCGGLSFYLVYLGLKYISEKEFVKGFLIFGAGIIIGLIFLTFAKYLL